MIHIGGRGVKKVQKTIHMVYGCSLRAISSGREEEKPWLPRSSVAVLSFLERSENTLSITTHYSIASVCIRKSKESRLHAINQYY